jgi:hypothetical protein
MYTTQSETAIPIRKARATLRALTESNQPLLILNHNWPYAILVPLPHNRCLSPAERSHARARLRTQFGRLLFQALPKGT